MACRWIETTFEGLCAGDLLRFDNARDKAGYVLEVKCVSRNWVVTRYTQQEVWVTEHSPACRPIIAERAIVHRDANHQPKKKTRKQAS